MEPFRGATVLAEAQFAARLTDLAANRKSKEDERWWQVFVMLIQPSMIRSTADWTGLERAADSADGAIEEAKRRHRL